MTDSKRKTAVFSLTALLILALLIIWGAFLGSVSFYIAAAALLVISMLPFLFRFEKGKSTAREITLIASLVALAVVSRAVFYLLPQVKPIAAVVIISAVCLGGERGYVIGALSAFVSNFIFGQGYWTPFQMAALATVGLISGIIFKKFKPNRFSLAAVGFILAFAVYGLIVDISTVLVMYGNKITLGGILSVYAAGIQFSLVFGVSTAVFLFLFGMPFISKLDRVITKYGIIKKD